MSEHGVKRSKREIAAMVGLELLTVFIGVTLAFAFDNYRQNRNTELRQQQLEHAIYEDLGRFNANASNKVRHLREGVARFDSLRAAGMKPPPFYFRIPGAERPPQDVWQAAMQSGAGELLDLDVMLKLASFYNETSGEEGRYVRYAAFTEQRIFPLLESDTAAFYDPRTGDLKPEFKGHLRQLKEITDDIDDQTHRARALLTSLAVHLR